MMLEHERDSRLMNAQAIIAAIAHEVRQPLTAIAMNVGVGVRLLDRAPPNHDEVRRALDLIKSDIYRTSEMFDSFRILFGTANKERQQIDMNAMLLGVLQSLQGEFNDRGVTTRRELTSELPIVEGHGTQLQQVIYNLVNNALEAMESTTDKNRVLRIRTELHGREAIGVALEDSGPGFDPKRSKAIFDAFVTTKTRGMGLGLAICRMIIERHGGQLTASSDGKNGASFQFVLPIKSADNATDQAQ